MKNKFIVASYYTRNTPYSEVVKPLLESLDRLKIPNYVEAIESKGGWLLNTLYKGLFLRDVMNRYKDCAIIWVDCDAVFHSYPHLFETLDADVACHVIEWKDYRDFNQCIQWASGTVFFANNDNARLILDEWIKINADNPRTLDQMNLELAVKKYIHRIKFVNLPPQYCKIFDSMRVVEDAVIEHFQASRKYRPEEEK